MIGYKVMSHTPNKKWLLSLADNTKRYSVSESVIRMPGQGIYLGLLKEFVLDYYSGLSENEVLVTFEFMESNILTGNITDRESVVTVSEAIIVGLDYI